MNRTTTAGLAPIDLLTVIVIIGILAAIAIPRFASTRENAYLAAMRNDLRRLAEAEEVYLARSGTYANESASNVGGAAVPSAATRFVPSPGVSVNATANAGTGWKATATHTGTPKRCYIFLGDQGPNGTATVAGEPRCDP